MSNRPYASTRLEHLGPIRVSEPWFSRRVRLHQAWYRYAVLGLEGYGTTRPPHERPLGSILPVAASSQGLNLHSAASRTLFDQRRAEGWGIDPVRTQAYLTSSQALTLNLFAPLVASPTWMLATLNAVLPAGSPLTSIDTVDVEYFSRYPSEALGDRTTIDVVVHARRGARPVVIAIETKLGDRFNSRQVNVGHAYERVSDLWRSPDTPRERLTSQLARVHALAEHMSRSNYSGAEPSQLLLLHHGDDPSVRAVFDAYSSAVVESATVRAQSLAQLLDAMDLTAPSGSEKELLETLRLRYVDLAPSEPVWSEFLETFPSKRRRVPDLV